MPPNRKSRAKKLTKRDDGIALAIKKAGGVRALARMLGVAHQALMGWRRIPASRILQIEMLTGIPREKLRPDLYAPREK
jgi:DNA-binding transcriptional regulator YdaS (Cro superfamily)